MPATSLKRDSGTGACPVKFAKFLRTPIMKNIWERLLLHLVFSSMLFLVFFETSVMFCQTKYSSLWLKSRCCHWKFSDLFAKFRTVVSFFMVVRLSKNVGYHGWPTTVNWRLHWLKCPKTVPKTKLEPGKKWLNTSC